MALLLTGFNEISIELKMCLEASWQPFYATKLNKNDTSLEFFSKAKATP